jgi:PIN domain nuclease of toxin-antitoxin system
VRFLIDSHAFLWWMDASPALGGSARAAITDPTNEVLISIAGLWELTIKIPSGKLSLPTELERRDESGLCWSLNHVPASTAPCKFAPASSRSV